MTKMDYIHFSKKNHKINYFYFYLNVYYMGNKTIFQIWCQYNNL